MLDEEKMTLDQNGNIPVWGKMSNGGKPFYTFQLTQEDKFIMFPQVTKNPKAPKFIIKFCDPSLAERGEG